MIDHSQHDCGWLRCRTAPKPRTAIVVPCDSDVTMTATGDLQHRCPFVDELDNGRITIVWRVAGQTLELHALRDYLREFKDAELSHEEVTDRIRHDLSTMDGIELLSVETTWTTARMEVSCSTSPTLAGVTP